MLFVCKKYSHSMSNVRLLTTKDSCRCKLDNGLIRILSISSELYTSPCGPLHYSLIFCKEYQTAIFQNLYFMLYSHWVNVRNLHVICFIMPSNNISSFLGDHNVLCYSLMSFSRDFKLNMHGYLLCINL